MDNFLVYSDTDSEEEKIIKNEYYEKRAALEKGNAEKSSLEQLKEKFEKRLENEQKREVLQKELAEMDSRAITLKKLIDEETDPVTRDKLISDLEQVEQQRVSKYNELIDVTDFSYALEDKKKEAQETILNNRTEGASILEALKTETDEGKRETMQSRLKELSSEERRLKEIIGIQNLRDSQKSLISDAEKIERKIVLQEEEKGYEHELKILKELKKEKKAR